MQQWLWDDMDQDMRLRVAYLCLCVAELHAGGGQLLENASLVDAVSISNHMTKHQSAVS